MPNSDYRFVYTDDNGQVVIVSPVDDCGLTLEQIKDKDCPQDRSVYTVNKSVVPTDRNFRNAWTYTE
tara:strand:- start:23 stop:223 length:201 start_codon:yes stop_codon:yes gene_type:complete